MAKIDVSWELIEQALFPGSGVKIVKIVSNDEIKVTFEIKSGWVSVEVTEYFKNCTFHAY